MIFVWSIASIIFFAIWLVCTLLFIARRNIEPIRSRGWEMVLVTNFMNVFHFTFLCAILDLYRVTPSRSCNVLVWEGILFIPLWSAPYIVRTFRLYFKYRLEKEKNEKEGKTTWFHDHHYLISLPYLFAQCFLLVGMVFITSLIFQLALPKPGDYNQLVECFNLQRIPLVISGFTSTCLVVLLAILILPVKDAFFIKGELAISAFFIPPFLVAFLILEWLDLLPDLKYLFPLSSILLSFVTIILSPLFLTFRHRQLALMISRSENESLGGLSSPEIFEICLSNPILFDAFRQHCIESFCVENALFYRDALHYREMEEKERRIEITNIRTLYLKENSRLLINILGKTRTTILEEIERENLPPELLNIAMKEVFQQMYQDTFPKFKVSSRFQQAWKKSKSEKNSSVRSNKSASKAREHQPVSRKGSEEDNGKFLKVPLSSRHSRSSDHMLESDPAVE